MNTLPPQYQAAHDALTQLGEAKEANCDVRYKAAYDSYMRALRNIDIIEFDEELHDSYGKVMKKKNESSPSSARAWEHELPEDIQ